MKVLLARMLLRVVSWMLGSGTPAEPTITQQEAIRLAAASYQDGYIRGLWGARPSHGIDVAIVLPREGTPRWGVLS